MVAKTVSTSSTTIQSCRSKPHSVPSDWTSPVTREARQNGTMTNQPKSSIETKAERTTWGSWLVSPAIASARNPATAPSHPTDVVT